MSNILKKYEEATSPTVEDARAQSMGDQTKASNYFDMKSTYQDNFTTKPAGTKTVSLSGDDDDTHGNFKKISDGAPHGALFHYKQEVIDLAQHNSVLYHKHTKDDNYISKNVSAKGTIYQSRVSEK